ncbi:hypothetical protein HMPREF9238_01267 [Gleimia europaea ACS-120-V-Col10b]|uniref:Uncharacterized protein n=2 Tax=Gleimia TaxID=2692113 RepID=A0A9W5VX09_9ACTO|nr:hypothetical protein HMPREF9238_01267 [Gleimia europaea ACS-120-V-Col10b]
MSEKPNNKDAAQLEEELGTIRWVSVGESAMKISELAHKYKKSCLYILRIAEETLLQKIENTNKRATNKVDLFVFLFFPFTLLISSCEFIGSQPGLFVACLIAAIILTMPVVFYWKTPPVEWQSFHAGLWKLAGGLITIVTGSATMVFGGTDIKFFHYAYQVSSLAVVAAGIVLLFSWILNVSRGGEVRREVADCKRQLEVVRTAGTMLGSHGY